MIENKIFDPRFELSTITRDLTKPYEFHTFIPGNRFRIQHAQYVMIYGRRFFLKKK